MKQMNKFRVGPLPCSDCYIGEDFNEEYFGELREKRLTEVLADELNHGTAENWT